MLSFFYEVIYKSDKTCMKNSKSLMNRLKKYLKDPLFLFRLSTALKITLIPAFSFFLVMAMMWLFVHMNLIFFEANGFLESESLKQAYYDFIYGSLTNYYIGCCMFLSCLFFLGNYIAGLMLRPFESLSDYCEKAQNNLFAPYAPDLFSDLRLMTKISEYFFQYLYDCREKGYLHSIEVPKRFTKIRSPKFEKTYFFHFGLFLGAIGIFSSISLYMFSIDVQEKIIELSLQTLNYSESVMYFLEKEKYFVNIVLWTSISLQMFSYSLLTVNLCSKISSPSFGVFSTMRSFMKGNFSARVHLIGYGFLRPHCRRINKYLDYVQREIERKNKKVG